MDGRPLNAGGTVDLAIESLVRTGRRDEARARADAFFRRFPDSVHRARIESVLASP